MERKRPSSYNSIGSRHVLLNIQKEEEELYFLSGENLRKYSGRDREMLSIANRCGQEAESNISISQL